MVQTGFLLGLLALAWMVGGVVGGALTDRLGRRKLILFGLLASALSALSFGAVSDLAWLFPVAALVGLFSEIGGPAHAAMIADILPPAQRQEGFGILRVVGNMSWLVGPTLGGFVARSSFFALFVLAAVWAYVVARNHLEAGRLRRAPASGKLIHERQGAPAHLRPCWTRGMVAAPTTGGACSCGDAPSLPCWPSRSRCS